MTEKNEDYKVESEKKVEKEAVSVNPPLPSIRELRQKDVYRLSKIIKKLEIKDGIKTLFRDATGKGKEEKKKMGIEVGVDLALLFAENAYLAEDDVNFFLADLMDPPITKQQFGDLPIKQSFAVIKSLFSNPEILDFFDTASELMK